MKVRNKVMSVVLAAPLMVLAGTAVAMDPAELLGTLDTDGNGSISAEEAAANEEHWLSNDVVPGSRTVILRGNGINNRFVTRAI